MHIVGCPTCGQDYNDEFWIKGCPICMGFLTDETAKPSRPKEVRVAVKEAGAIILRDGKVLLVRSNKKPHPWFFPKGHVEVAPPELPEETAVRELEEETGVVCYLVKKLGDAYFMRDQADFEVQYYLGHYVGEVKPKEARNVFWCPVELALKILTIDDLKDLLIEAIKEYE
jgi:ADP-ribose pyrophosphatase YjhB (NUDIX family)